MALTNEQSSKASFVDSELTEVLNSATNGFVDCCEYYTNGQDEFVIVKTVAGDSRAGITVNVTCDSLWAILKDVMRAVAARFE